jgi:sec-independent protein translocase protein TatB
MVYGRLSTVRERRDVFGISMWEVALILLVALIVLGPQQLAEVAKTMGKLYRDLQRMSSDVRNAIDLDSLASPPADAGPSKSTQDEEHRPAAAQEDFLPERSEKQGPDFYADLLESCKDDKTKEEASDSKDSQDSEPGPPVDTKKNGNEPPPAHSS